MKIMDCRTNLFLRAAIALGLALIGPQRIQAQTSSQPADGVAVAEVEYTFDTEASLEGLELHATGEAARRMPQPKIYENSLYLLESWWKSTAAAAFPAPTRQLCGTIEVSFEVLMNTGTEGAGFVWLDTETHGFDGPALAEFESWEAPSIAKSFGVGFDASNPPNRDPFRGSGNVYDRPQHEISLHWDGREMFKKTTDTEFRDEEKHRVRLSIDFVVGGAEITLALDDETVFDHYFIPSMIAYVGRPAFGARNAENAGDVMIDSLSIVCQDPIDEFEAPRTIMAIDHVLNDAGHPTHESVVEFPENTGEFRRIICTLRLDKPETRFDPWDRLAHVYVLDDDGERVEILRYITPYHKGGVWQMDVSDFRPLLTGLRKVIQHCGTQGEGWVVTVQFDFYPGAIDRLAYRVLPLWVGAPEVGNPDKPASDFYVPRTIAIDPLTSFGKVRSVVTGHGMSPNTNNAAEFMPLGRTLTINGESHYNVLWKADNYLNPCRPQGGTWKYDRAGWAPGDVVRPWEIDATPYINDSRQLEITYVLDEYLNEGRGKTWAPTHNTAAYLILYREPD